MTQGEDFQWHTLPRLDAIEINGESAVPPSGSLHRPPKQPYKADPGFHLAVPSTFSKRRSSAPVTLHPPREEPDSPATIRRKSLERSVPTFGVGKKVPRGFPSLARRTSLIQGAKPSGDADRSVKGRPWDERLEFVELLHVERPAGLLNVPDVYLTADVLDEETDFRSDMGTAPSSYHLPSIYGTQSQTISECDSASSQSLSRRGSEQQQPATPGQRRASENFPPNIHRVKEYTGLPPLHRNSEQLSKVKRGLDRRGSDGLLSAGGDNSTGTITAERRHSDDLSSQLSRNLNPNDTMRTDNHQKHASCQTNSEFTGSVKTSRQSNADKEATSERHTAKGSTPDRETKFKFRGFFEPLRKPRSKKALKKSQTDSAPPDVDPLAIIKASLMRLMRQTSPDEASQERPPEYEEVPAVNRVILTPAAIQAMDPVRPTPFVNSRDGALLVSNPQYNSIYASFEEMPELLSYDKFEFVCKWLEEVENWREVGGLDGEEVTDSELAWSFETPDPPGLAGH